MARPKIVGVERPPCPKNHTGTIYLDGHTKSRQGSFERTRFRCIPNEPGEKAHIFVGPLPRRRDPHQHAECDACERPFARAQGLSGAWHFSFVIQEIATALVRAGRGNAYREISQDLREAVGRLAARGAHPGLPTTGGQLAMDYIDAFAPIVLAPHQPTRWPAIVAVDSIPLRVSDHSVCCADRRRKQAEDEQAPTLEVLLHEEGSPLIGIVPDEPTKHYRPKLGHSADIKEIGQVLVAVGQDTIARNPKPLLARFVGAGDELAWTEFFLSLPGTPTWIVSDRSGAITTAVGNVWHGATTHYFCEQHIAKNAADAARKDGCADGDTIFALIERAQWGQEQWNLLVVAAHEARLTNLSSWLRKNLRLLPAQQTKRREHVGYPRSAGACEGTIRQIKAALGDRVPHFRNANRLNLLLELVVAETNGRASVSAHSRALRTHLTPLEGRANPDWGAIRDPLPRRGASSMETLLVDAVARGRDHRKARQAAKRAAQYQARKSIFEAERPELGALAQRRRDLAPKRKAVGSVSGKTVADFPELTAQWHPSQNGHLRPEDMPAGTGLPVWWHCSGGVDHDWQAQVRSRTISGARCPFCVGRRVAPSEALDRTHPEIAAEWHVTRNGTKTPSQFSRGSAQYAWWQCRRYAGHVWRARINSRTGIIPAGCPLCAAHAGKGGRGSGKLIELMTVPAA